MRRGAPSRRIFCSDNTTSPIDGRCLFFEDGCRIYPVRPMQCQTFPFWFANLRSETRWDAIRSECPGIGSGRRFNRHEILDILQGN